MKDKHRKVYNKNLFGMSDVAILKSYYVDFKTQQQKNKVTDIDSFLDRCIDEAISRNWLSKILRFFPLFCSRYKAEQQRISKFIILRRPDVIALFRKNNITDNEIEDFLYGTSGKTEDVKTIDNYLEPVREKIIKCYSIKGKKQLGDRIFGYLLASELLPAYTPEERLKAWYDLVGTDITPSDVRLHATPYLNRSHVDTKTLLKHLDDILDFYDSIGLDKVVRIVQRNMDELSGKS